MRKRQWVGVVVASFISCAAVSCGPTGIEMIGDAMVDAGERLMDAGRALTDGGDAMMSDAQAQEGCASSCTPSGVLRVMTSDTDPTRLETGTLVGDSSASSHVVAEGPFVLTDLMYPSTGATAWTVYTSPVSEACSTLPGRIITRVQQDTRLTGMRIHVRAGEKLCAVPHDSTRPQLRWAGFRPYDG